MSETEPNRSPDVPTGPAGGPPPGATAAKKPRTSKAAIRKLLHYIATYQIRLSLELLHAIGICAALSAVFTIVGPDDPRRKPYRMS